MENVQKQNLYIIYSRKSKFTGKGESIENQIDMCKKYLLNKYGNIENDIRIFQDEGFTGYNTRRPQFQEMMKNVKEKNVKCVIVYRLDRISRNVSDFCNLKNEFAKYNVSFISVTENFDTSTPLGSAMLMISSVFAQLERDTIAERIKDNMYELAKTGRWLGGTTPLGYKSERMESVDINGKRRSLYRLVQIENEIKTIKLIWDKMQRLKGLGKLESYLLQQGVKTRNNNNFTRFSLITILKNPVYVIADKNIKSFFESLGATIYAKDSDFDGKHGLIAYNKRLEKDKKKRTKDISEWIISIGKHSGIIDSNDFIKTWQLLENNKNKRFRIPRINKSILSGIIQCKHCGNLMRPRLRNSYTSSGQRNFVYLCELKDKSRKQLCDCKNVNGIEIDKSVVEEINKLSLPVEYLVISLKKMINASKKETRKRKKEFQTLMTVFTKNKMKIENLIDRLAIIDVSIVDKVTNQIKELENRNSKIEDELNKLKKESDIKVTEKSVDALALNLIKKYMDSFNTFDLIKKRTLIRLLISSVEVDEKNVYINYVGSNNVLRP